MSLEFAVGDSVSIRPLTDSQLREECGGYKYGSIYAEASNNTLRVYYEERDFDRDAYLVGVVDRIDGCMGGVENECAPYGVKVENDDDDDDVTFFWVTRMAICCGPSIDVGKLNDVGGF